MPKKRRSDERTYKKQLLIVCEGEKTEPFYLRKFKKLCELEKVVRVEIIDSKYTSARELVADVIKYREMPDDELWAVFDKDGYTKHPEAFCLARDNGVKIAFSSICFEYWLLLHFERTTRSFLNSKKIEKYLSDSGHISRYEKGDELIFDKVVHRIQTAINNAKWVRKEKEKSEHAGCQIYQMDPYTNIDRLLKAIEDLREVYQRTPTYQFHY